MSYRIDTLLLGSWLAAASVAIQHLSMVFPDLQHLLLLESGPFRTAMLSLLFPGPRLAAALSQSVSQGQGFKSWSCSVSTATSSQFAGCPA